MLRKNTAERKQVAWVAMLPPIRLSCVEVWISRAFPCSREYEGGTQSHEHINCTIMERYEWASITCQVAALYSLVCEIHMPLDVLLAPFWKSENPLCSRTPLQQFLGPLHTGDSVAGDKSTSDSEYIASNEGFRTVDFLRKVSRRENYCRLSSLVARRQGDSRIT
jgi:hypothetical protein